MFPSLSEQTGIYSAVVLFLQTLSIFLLNSDVADALLSPGDLPAESLLKEALLEHYDASVRPTYNASEATRVVMDLALQQIIDVDEKQQLMRATVWMRLYWKDEFMKWNPDDYGGVQSLKFVPKKLWLPDICIYDALQPAVHANEMQDFYISVDHDGNVMWLSPLVIQSVCHFNVRFFPYDTQFCTLTVGSWLYNGEAVDIWNKNSHGDTDSFKDNVEWEIQNFTVTRIVTIYNCCPEPYPVLDFTLTIQRRPGFYVTYLYIPSVVIIASSLFAFYLPPGSDAKVDLAVTGLLSQTVFLLLISDLMPPDAYNPPFLGQCLTILLIIQAAAVVVIVIIKRAHDDSIHKNKPPSRRLFLCMHYLKYPFFMYHINYKPEEVDVDDADDDMSGNENFGANFDDAISESKVSAAGYPANGHVINGNGVHMNGLEKKVLVKINSFTTPNKQPIVDENNIETLNLDGATKIPRNPSISSLGSGDSAVMDTLKCILDEMRLVRTRRKAMERQEIIADQWRRIAAMYDRILFICFMISIIGITVWFLTLQPTADSQRDPDH